MVKEVEHLREEGNTQFRTGKRTTNAVDAYAAALEVCFFVSFTSVL